MDRGYVQFIHCSQFEYIYTIKGGVSFVMLRCVVVRREAFTAHRIFRGGVIGVSEVRGGVHAHARGGWRL